MALLIALGLVLLLGGFPVDRSAAAETPPMIAGKEASPVQGVLSLEEAIGYALAHNRTLSRAELGLTASELSLQSQKDQFRLEIVPAAEIGYSSDAENAWEVGVDLNKKLTGGMNLSLQPRIGEEDGDSIASADVALNLPLLRGAGEAYAMDGVYSSLYAYEEAQRSYYSQQISTVLQTVQAVYDSIESGLQVELLEKELTTLNEHLALAKIKEKAGVVGAIDLYRAEIRIKTVQEQLNSVRESRDNTLGEVKSILAIPQSGAVTITASLDFKPLKIDLNEAIAIALNNRIEIEQTKRLIAETERQVALAKNDLLPQLDLQLGYNRRGEDSTFDFSDESYTARLNSDSDLFRRNEKSAYAQKKIQMRQLILDQEGQREDISQEIRVELNALEKQEQRIALREEQLIQTTGKMRLAESKFRNGMADNFDLIEAQAEMQEAQTNRLVERIGYIVRTYRLRSALGTLLERKVVKK